MKIRYAFLYLLAVIVFSGCASNTAVVSKNVVHSFDNTPIFYKTCGKGDTTLVFVHGWCCNGSYWNKQVEYFRDKYQIVTIDLAGHGLSGKNRTDYTFDAYAQDVEAVVAQLKGRVILIGHSMSGEIIIKTANLMGNRVTALIGVDTLQDVSETVTQEIADQYLSIFAKGFKEGMGVFLGEMFNADDDPVMKQRIIEQMSSADPKIALNTLRHYFNDYVNGDVLGSARRLSIPIYCINADQWPTNIEGNKANFPKYMGCEIIPNAGHFIMMTQADEFNRKLEKVLKRINSVR